MTTPAKSKDLRICPTCWSVVHTDDLDEHRSWHDRLRAVAVAEAKRELAAERRMSWWRALTWSRSRELDQAGLV